MRLKFTELVIGMGCLSMTAQAELSISNGDFEANGTQTTDVSGWFDPTASDSSWWMATWAGPNASPNGTPVLGLSYMNATLNWAYQSIGINDTAITNLLIQYDVGSFTDAGSTRDLGLTFSIYESDGTFSGANDTDIADANNVTLIDSITVYSGGLSAGELLSSQSVTLDLSSAGTDTELFLRIQNQIGSTGEPWAAVDNITLGTSTNSAPKEEEIQNPFTNAYLQAEPFPMNRVRLLDSRFGEMQEMHRTGYLAWIDPDRLLHPYRVNAGLDTQGADSLGGWDGDEGSSWGANACRGHMLGHYLSAASKMYASTGDTQYLEKVSYIVTELRKCQDALAETESRYGYLAGIQSTHFDTLETNPTSALVPFYTVHKTFAGLVDAYKLCGLDLALTIAGDMSDYHQWRIDQLNTFQIEAMFRTDNGNSEEWGGMNEALTELYVLSNARGDTNAVRHLEFAELFQRDWFINPLEENRDELNGLHANTHVPQVVGFAHTAALLNTNDTERARLYTAADHFWHMVTEEHSFVLGGNSYAEHFSDPGKETGSGGSLLSWNTAETCNTYNMLKLTAELFEHSPSIEYADFYERALYNHILASISPETGMATYFVSLEPGHFKTYGQPEGSCWCCTGTGLENPAQYGQHIYFHNADALWVNLYIPSTLKWNEKGITLTQESDFPNDDEIRLTINCTAPVTAAIRLRIPSWCPAAATVKVNGEIQNINAAEGSYAELNRTWNNGDLITLTLPMNLRLDRSMDDDAEVSLFYGPVLLAGDLGTENMPDNWQETADQWDHQSIECAAAPSLITSDAADVETWVHSTSTTSLVFTADAAFSGSTNRASVVLKPFYDTHHTRYTVYWNLIAPAAFSTWNGSGTSSDWSDSTNWDAAPAEKNALRFSDPTGGETVNDLADGTVFSGLSFAQSSGAFTLNGQKIGLQGDVINNSSNPQTINLSMVLQDNLPWYFDAAGEDLLLGGELSGSGMLMKQGSHSVVLQSNALFSGAIYVNEGALEVGNGGNPGTLPVSLSKDTALILNRADEFALEAPISGTGTVIKRGSGTLDLLTTLENRGGLRVEEGTVRMGARGKSGLLHRWSFNGNLTDSVGNSDATLVNVGANNATLSDSDILLSGGSRSASDYVQLGSGLLSDAGGAVTIELWATPVSFQSWARIFDIGSSTAENLFMVWYQSTGNSDRVEWKDNETATVNNTYAPYFFTEYHIALVIAPGTGSGGTTAVRWYVAPASDETFGESNGHFETANTLAELNDVNFWLGRSHYSSDATANARYNEVRIWDHALSAIELEQLHVLGPDSVELSGALCADSPLEIAAGASIDFNGTTQQVASLSGDAEAILNLGSKGMLVIGSGNSDSTAFAGNISGSGTLENNGTLRLIGQAEISSGIVFTNNGLLDVLTWNGTLPDNYVNNGTILDSDQLQFGMETAGSNWVLQTVGYEGHTYQFQSTTNLITEWNNLGDAHTGAGETIQQATTTTNQAAFFRLKVQP